MITIVKEVTMETIDNWKHRSMGMRCLTCMFFVIKVQTPVIRGEVVGVPVSEKSDRDSVEFGRCRRHAPTMSGFPAVFGTDWCGDHKLDENKV